MKRFVRKGTLAALMALLLTAPLAAATSVDRSSSASGSGCGDTCSATVDNAAWSYSADGDCFGTAGAYTACRVWHQCNALFTGVLAQATLTCSSDFTVEGTTSTCTTATETVCTAATWEYAIVPRGQCGNFYSDGTVVSPTGTLTVSAPAIRVCVNANGPY